RLAATGKPGRFAFRCAAGSPARDSAQPHSRTVAPDASHRAQPQQIACAAFRTQRKTFHGTQKVRASLETHSFLTNLRLPSVAQHSCRRMRIDDAPGPPLSQSRTGNHEHHA
ncbi:hypothetical protein, partial [Burkholderia stabilis]|uniref:hypothetical protein n=1 Tax=Burkholderia stabilis TaxID=95485 RepID=UPI001F4B51A2